MKPQPYTTLDRIVAILACFEDGESGLRLTDLVRKTNLHKSTLYRLLEGMRAHGLLGLDGRALPFWGSGCELGSIAMKRLDLDRLGQPVLQRLAEQAEETTHLCVVDGSDIVTRGHNRSETMKASNGKPSLWAEQYPELGTGPIPTDRCFSPEYYALERERVFKRVWLKVGRVEEIPEPRDYKVKRIEVANTSLILVRGDDGQIRGFHNVCSHRGNKVVWGDDLYGFHGRARGRAFVCHFHGWAYNLHGELVSVPQEELFFNLERCANGLTPVATDTWNGFIFVNLDPDPPQSLKDYLGGAGVRLEGFPFEQMPRVYEYYTVLNCNWKIALDAFSEAYHVATVHAGSFPGVFDAAVKQVGMYGPHHSGAAFQKPAPSPGPVATLSYRLATASIAKPGSRSSLPASVNPERDPEFVFDQTGIFPNYLIDVSDGLYFTHQFWPLSIDKTLWEGIQYFPHARTAGERFSQEYGQVLQRNAWLEDTGTMEATQIALSSGVKKVFNFQDDEVMLRHSYKVIEEFISRA